MDYSFNLYVYGLNVCNIIRERTLKKTGSLEFIEFRFKVMPANNLEGEFETNWLCSSLIFQ